MILFNYGKTINVCVLTIFKHFSLNSHKKSLIFKIKSYFNQWVKFAFYSYLNDLSPPQRNGFGNWGILPQTLTVNVFIIIFKVRFLPPKQSLKTCNKPIKLICIFTKFWIANIGNSYKKKQNKQKHLFNGYFVNCQVHCVPPLCGNNLVLRKTSPRQVKSWQSVWVPAKRVCLS